MRLLSCVRSSFIFVVLFCGFILFSFSQKLFASDAIGQVVWVKGTVQAYGSGGHARTLQRRSPIYENDTIETGSGSTQVVFTDNSMVALRAGTTFQISEYKFSSSSPGDGKYVAGLAKGGFRTITGLISKGNPDAYQVNTPVATIGVRGTDYSIFYAPSRGLAVMLNKGAIVVSNRGGSAELNAARNRVYAEIAGLKTGPVVTDKPAPVFGGQPGLTRATMVPVAPQSGATINVPSVEPTSSVVSPSQGPAKSASGLCIE